MGANKRFRAFEPAVVMLVPPSLDEWLPHSRLTRLTRFIADIVETQLERACMDVVAFRRLSAQQAPVFRSIARFRKRHPSSLANVFLQAPEPVVLPQWCRSSKSRWTARRCARMPSGGRP